MVTGVLMVGSATICLACGAASKQWIALAASGIMLAAMIDTLYLETVPRIAWAFLLVVSALALGARLRTRGTLAGPAVARPFSAARVAAVLIAVSYVVMAALLLIHGADPVPGGDPHTAHQLPITLWVQAGTIVTVLGLRAAAALAARARRRVLAIDAASMAVMLAVMLLPH